MVLQNKRIDEDLFLKMRKDVLSEWPTGQEVENLDDSVAYQRSLPRSKVLALMVRDAIEKGTTLLTALAGVALLDEHIDLLKALQEAGCDFLPTNIDSRTRWHEFQAAGEALEESKKAGRSMLNGFPAVNHGVSAVRRITEALDLPVLTRQCGPDPRIYAEITLAGGFQGMVGSQMGAFSSYTRDHTLEECVRTYQYVDRLCGYYEEHGVPMFRDIVRFAVGAGGIPPSISIAYAIFASLFAAEQGVKTLAPQYYQQGSMIQNVAGIMVEQKLVRDYLDRFGYHDVVACEQVLHWNGQFPLDEEKGYALLSAGAIVASLSGANILVSKSAMEGFALPTLESNAASMRAVRYALDLTRFQRMPLGPDFVLEMQMIEKEVRLMVDRSLELGNGDPVQGAVCGFHAGILDGPFSPNRNIAGRVLPAKDKTGAIRYLDFGSLPFDADIRDYHREKLEERCKWDGRTPDLSLVIDDVLAAMMVPSKK